MIKYKPKVSLVGLVSGVLLGASILALLHQNGSLYPTRNLAIASVVVGALVCGIVLPSLTRLAKVGKVNRRLAGRAPADLKRLALYVIGVYQRDVAHTLGSACPFEPTCSEYARLAFERHGALRATRLVVGRLRRCRPGYLGPFTDPP